METSSGRDLLRACLRRSRRTLAAAMVSSFVRQLAFLALPYLLGRAVQEVVADGRTDRLAWYVAVLATVVLVEFAGLCGWMMWSNLAEARLAAGLREDVLGVVLDTDDAALATRTDGYGDTLSRAVEDVDVVLVWVHGLATWVVIGTTVVVLVPSIAGIDPSLLLVALGCAALLLVVNLTLPPRFARRIGAFAQAQASRTRTVEELTSAYATLRGVGGEAALVRRHDARSADVTERIVAVARIRSLWAASGEAVPFAGIAVGLAVGGLAALDGRMDVGQLTTFTLWMGTVQLATNAIVARLGDFGAARVSAERITAVLELGRPRDSAGAPAPGAATDHAPSLALTGVAAAGAAPVTFTLSPGDWGLVTGPTGVGKSTLLRAVAGLSDHTGAIRWCGAEVGRIPVAERFEQIVLVPQAPLLLHGTVRDNLLLAADPSAGPPPSDARLREVCRTAAFDVVLEALPDGLDTVVGERGSTLSGGERQRLALARALLRDTPVLLLDDVTSALDEETEHLLLDRLRARTDDRVVLFAGHRPAVRSRADHVVELHPTEVVARG
ncbi:UNVERIFIED_CONTAM: hypothetical protein LK11_33040 [Mumia flava]|nr:ABC transporter ATP-binding protein [Mumia flava]